MLGVVAAVAESFFERPILNSPYEAPRLHHALDQDGQPLEVPPVHGRRRSELITPVPKPRKQKVKAEQGKLVFGDEEGLTTTEQEYNPTPIINEIRSHVASWRELPNPADWGVTPATARLLTHWRHHNFEGVRPFFCQVEAAETVIWLTEVARQQKRYAKFWEHLKGANEQANPELLRVAMKMATGSGKTTVMAMLIGWQTVNAVRSPTSNLFSRGFLIITPGITIRDRLRVLLPDDPDNYYRTRELLPATCWAISQGQDRHFELPYLQAARDHGPLQGRPRSAPGPRRGAGDHRDRRARCFSALAVS